MHKFFKKSSDEEREHAEKLLKYQNMRGGKIFLKDVSKPTNDEWGSPLEAFQAALSLERKVNETLLELHKVASDRGDAHLADFLEAEFLDEQVRSIKELSGFVTQLQRVGSGVGEFLFDKELCE
jgi:ferritin heavy chain